MPKRNVLFWLVVAGMAVTAAGFAVWLQNSHPTVTYDSAFYLSASRNLASGRGLVVNITSLWDNDFTEPFKRWAPLYPVLGAVTVLLGLPAITGLALWSALAFGLTVVFISLLGRRLGGVPAGLVAGAFTLLSLSWWQMGSAALSDMTFTAFVAAFFWLFAEALVRKSDRWLLAAGVAAALAALTRQIGFLIPFTGGLWLLLEALRRPRVVKFARAAAFGFGSVAPLVAFTLSSPFWKGEGGSSWSPPAAPFAANLGFFTKTLRQDYGLVFAPMTLPNLVLLVLRVGLIAATLAVIAVSLGRWWRDGSYERLGPILPGVLHFFLYLFLIVGLRSWGSFAYLETRLVSPTYPPLLAALAATGVWLFERARKLPAGVWRSVALAVVAAAVIAVPRWGAMPSKVRLQRAGAEFASERWRNNPVTARIKGLKPRYVVTYSTGYTYLYTDIPTKPMPIKRQNQMKEYSKAANSLGSDFLVYVPDPYKPLIRERYDVETLLDPSKFEIVVYSPTDLVVKPRF